MNDPSAESTGHISRRDFLKLSGAVGANLLLKPPQINIDMPPIPHVLPESRTDNFPVEVGKQTEAAYQQYLDTIISEVPPTHDKKDKKPFDAGIGYATRYGRELQTGAPTALYHTYCAVFRSRLDMVRPGELPLRLENMFKVCNLYDLYLSLWEKNAQVQEIMDKMPYSKYVTHLCTPRQLHEKLIIPEKSDLLANPDPEKMLASKQVMSLGATSQPLVLGNRYLVYQVEPSTDAKFTKKFVGTTIAVDVPWNVDQARLDNLHYNTHPWDTKPLPWVFDASNNLFSRLPGVGEIGKPGVLMISEDTYRKYHPLHPVKWE